MDESKGCFSCEKEFELEDHNDHAHAFVVGFRNSIKDNKGR